MPSSAAGDRRAYRRGLVVGLTLAEVFLLVLFCLLLVWMIATRETHVLASAVQSLHSRLAELEAERSALLGVTSPNRFDELFRELVVARQRLEQQASRLQALEERARIIDTVAHDAGIEATSPDALSAEVRSRLEIANALLAVARESSLGKTDRQALEKTLAGLLELRQRLSAEGLGDAHVATLAGRLRNAERRLQEVTRGTEWPACWADPSGKPEYIFDISLNSPSISIHDNALPHRRSEQATLPLSSIAFETDLSPAAFRSRTAALFEWSRRANCRFFVRLHDMTAVHEKDIYKTRVRNVGEHFYYYESLASGGTSPSQ